MNSTKGSALRRAWFWILILFVIIGAGVTINAVKNRSGAGEIASQEEKQLYQCPMHPDFILDHPGVCGICGMNLVPMEKEGGEGAQDMYPSDVADHTTIYLTPEKIQLIGVRTGKVETMDTNQVIRAVGTVQEDETRLHTINAKIEGWVEKLYVNFEGETVKKGQSLLTIYSPELVSTQEEYLLALRSRERLGDSQFPEIAESGERLVEASRTRLKLWDIPDSEIARVEKSGRPLRTLTIYAPASGIVTQKLVNPGMRIMAGAPLYEVADLSRVWVEASIYENEAGSVKLGDSASIMLDAYPNKKWNGRIVFVSPVIDSQTRTIMVRFDFANPGLILKPGMFVNVDLENPLGEQLVVPFEAVLDSGDRKFVFIYHEDGHFQPRIVQLGEKVNDEYYIVNSGLEVGDTVVTSGNFLVDSESRLKLSNKTQSMPGMGMGDD